MLTSLTLDDSSGAAVTLHETDKRAATKALGFYGVSAPRDSKRVRPQAHGSINETRWGDGRTMSIEMEIISNVGVADAYNEFRAVVAPMQQTLDVGPALMKWQEPSGLALQRLVKLDSEVDPPLQEAAAILNFPVQFHAEDPRAYSQTKTTATGSALSTLGGGMTMPVVFPFTFTSSGGGAVSFTNAGNRPTPPVYRIYGQCVNPQVVLLTTPQTRIVINGTVAAGDYLELNVQQRTIMLNGTTSRLNFYDAANSQWAELPGGDVVSGVIVPKTSNLQLVAASFDASARLDVLARSAYA